MTVAIVDYGSGNLRSVEKAFERAAREAGLDRRIVVTSDPGTVRRADRIVLPGVGAFADCMAGLTAVAGMREAMEEAVAGRGVPFLGICVGMQLMAERGREFGVHPGLGWIRGEVRPLEPEDPALKVPHMGWNELRCRHDHPVLAGLRAGDHAYFANSFSLHADDSADVLADVDYGGAIVAAVGTGNRVGTQFHPEKSQEVGQRVIANFLAWTP